MTLPIQARRRIVDKYTSESTVTIDPAILNQIIDDVLAASAEAPSGGVPSPFAAPWLDSFLAHWTAGQNVDLTPVSEGAAEEAAATLRALVDAKLSSAPSSGPVAQSSSARRREAAAGVHQDGEGGDRGDADGDAAEQVGGAEPERVRDETAGDRADREKAATTSALARQFAVTPGAVSQHLAALYRARLLTRQRSGRALLYQTSDLGLALLGVTEVNAGRTDRLPVVEPLPPPTLYTCLRERSTSRSA